MQFLLGYSSSARRDARFRQKGGHRSSMDPEGCAECSHAGACFVLGHQLSYLLGGQEPVRLAGPSRLQCSGLARLRSGRDLPQPISGQQMVAVFSQDAHK